MKDSENVKMHSQRITHQLQFQFHFLFLSFSPVSMGFQLEMRRRGFHNKVVQEEAL